ncbi:MAG: hypothetical protein K0S28_1750, partial [Paucimonas sp.]|nr:hypothetical protein [Paucimonas sp.]
MHIHLTSYRHRLQQTLLGRLSALGRWATMAFVFLMIVAASASTQAASEPTASEPRIKAALLYKFIFYAEWPPEALPPSEPLSIGVFADDEVFDELRRITTGREVN